MVNICITAGLILLRSQESSAVGGTPEIMEHQMFGADSGGIGNNENRRKVWIMSLKLTMKREIFWQEEGT